MRSEEMINSIADAVLYEGYILWPYRRSALKNQRRFTFGGVYPPAHSVLHPDDPSSMQTEVLLRGRSQTTVLITVRFLQIVERDVIDGAGRSVDELVIAGERYLRWEEAIEREFTCGWTALDELRRGVCVTIAIAAGSREEALGDGAGSLVRRWESLSGELRVRAVASAGGPWRLSAQVINTTPFAGSSRDSALRRTLCSTHTLLHTDCGEFVSQTDPPVALAEAAARCSNEGTWPVLVGERGERSTVLSSPIILEDHPRVAPESPGDLFDGGEIDQLLTLNILAMTDEEKAEMAASDPRAREILNRTEALGPEQLMALHGTIRERGMVR